MQDLMESMPANRINSFERFSWKLAHSAELIMKFQQINNWLRTPVTTFSSENTKNDCKEQNAYIADSSIELIEKSSNAL